LIPATGAHPSTQTSPLITLYGIKNCTSVKQARHWLTQNGVDHRFHDFRAQGLTAALLDGWLREVGWEGLLNRRGTTWRQLPDSSKTGLDAAAARGLMLDHPTLIKRPVLTAYGAHLVGFAHTTYQEFFSRHNKVGRQ
jgi:arsenate reductase